jgi:hypothetical protein
LIDHGLAEEAYRDCHLCLQKLFRSGAGQASCPSTRPRHLPCPCRHSIDTSGKQKLERKVKGDIRKKQREYLTSC